MEVILIQSNLDFSQESLVMIILIHFDSFLLNISTSVYVMQVADDSSSGFVPKKGVWSAMDMFMM